MYNYYAPEMMPYQYGAIPELNPIGAGPLPNSYGPESIDPSRQVGLDSMLSTVGKAAGALNPIAGAAIGFLGNVAGKGLDYAMQGAAQKSLMNHQVSLNSPQAMMSRMHSAGINSAAAAQGIAGAPAAGASAGGSAPMSQGTPNLLDILANSENTRLTGDLLKSQTKDYEASADLKTGEAQEQFVKNKYVDRMYSNEVRKLVADGDISEHFAYMYSIDAKYHDAQAYAQTAQLFQNLQKGAQEILNLEQDYYVALAQEALLMEQAGLTRAQISKTFADIKLTNAEVEKVYAEVENIGMNTQLQAQEVSESEVRERLTRVRAQYEEKYYAIFDNLGFDMKSGIDSNLQYNIKSGNKAGAQEILNGLKSVILSTGEARFDSQDYNMDKALQIFDIGGRIFGNYLIGKGISKTSRGTTNTTQDFLDSRGNVTGSTRTYSYNVNTTK